MGCPRVIDLAQRQQKLSRVDDQRDGTPFLQGEAERVGIVQPGEEELQGDLTAAFQCLKGLTGKREREFLQGVTGEWLPTENE